MPNRTFQLELELFATRAEVARATEAVRQFCAEDGAGDELTHDLCLAVDEVLANIVLHGYAGAPESRIDLRLGRDDAGYTLEFVDRGLPFNPLAAASPDLEASAEERAIGGLGMTLVRAVMDGFDYAREGDANRLTLQRRRRAQTDGDCAVGVSVPRSRPPSFPRLAEESMPLTIRVTHEDSKIIGQVRVALDGSLDTATSPELEKALQPVYARQVRVLVFDLGGLRFLSSAGIRVLMTARKELNARGGSFVMTNLQPQIAKVIEIVKALPGVSVFRNDAEMDEYLTAMQKKVVEGEEAD